MVLASNLDEKMNNNQESMVLAPNPDEKMNNYQESMFWEAIDNKKQGPPRKMEAVPEDGLGFFDRLDFVAQLLDCFADVVP